MRRGPKETEKYTDDEFDSSLAKVLDHAPVGAKLKKTALPGLGFGKVRQQLKIARSDPQKWAREHRDEVRRASGRRAIARRLNAELPDWSEDEHAEFLSAFQASPTTQTALVGEWDEDKKKRWHDWITRAIPVLKVIAALVPPPYNLAVIALIVVLTLIDERRLQPAQLAEIFREQPRDTPDLVPDAIP